jgi:hypothetical protein
MDVAIGQMLNMCCACQDVELWLRVEGVLVCKQSQFSFPSCCTIPAYGREAVDQSSHSSPSRTQTTVVSI